MDPFTMFLLRMMQSLPQQGALCPQGGMPMQPFGGGQQGGFPLSPFRPMQGGFPMQPFQPQPPQGVGGLMGATNTPGRGNFGYEQSMVARQPMPMTGSSRPGMGVPGMQRPAQGGFPMSPFGGGRPQPQMYNDRGPRPMPKGGA